MSFVYDSINSISHLYTSDRLEPGWTIDNGIVCVVWEDDIELIKKGLEAKLRKPGSNHWCNCTAENVKSTERGRGCNNCFRNCRPCNIKCKCKGNCQNPHNNGGMCPKCDGHVASNSISPEQIPTSQTTETTPSSIVQPGSNQFQQSSTLFEFNNDDSDYEDSEINELMQDYDNLVQISENEEPSLSNVLFSARADLYPEYSDYPDYNEFLYEQTYDDNDLEF